VLLAPLAQLRLRGLPSLLLFAPARQAPLPCRLGQARLRRLGRRLARRQLAQRRGQRVIDQSLLARATEEILDLTAGRAASYAACANDFMKSARARAPATGIAL
jgi:hypothetical protein